MPMQVVTVPDIGNFTVVMQVVKGPSPTHVEFMQFGQASDNDLIVSQQFGSAGGTYLSDHGGAQLGGGHNRRRRGPLVGPQPLPGPDAAEVRAVQLIRSVDHRPQSRRSLADHRPDDPEPDDHRA